MRKSPQHTWRICHDDGAGLSEISEILNLPIAQIRGAIGAYCSKKARQAPVGEVCPVDVAIPKESSESVPIEPTSRQDRIDEIILAGASMGMKYTDIAAGINNTMGGCLLSDHISSRLKELRGDKS